MNASLAVAIENPAGKVLFSIGSVTAISTGERTLKKGDEVYQGDTIQTAGKSRLQLIMVDGARLSIRPNSALVIAEYTFNKKPKYTGSAIKQSNGKMAIDIVKGGFRTITGAIGHGGTKEENAANYQVRTPVATIGIRGTDYSIMFCSANCGQFKSEGKAANKGLYVGVSSGGVAVKNDSGTLNLTKNQFAYVPEPNVAPVKLIKPPEGLISEVEDIHAESSSEQSDDQTPTDNVTQSNETPTETTDTPADETALTDDKPLPPPEESTSTEQVSVESSQEDIIAEVPELDCESDIANEKCLTIDALAASIQSIADTGFLDDASPETIESIFDDATPTEIENIAVAVVAIADTGLLDDAPPETIDSIFDDTTPAEIENIAVAVVTIADTGLLDDAPPETIDSIFDDTTPAEIENIAAAVEIIDASDAVIDTATLSEALASESTVEQIIQSDPTVIEEIIQSVMLDLSVTINQSRNTQHIPPSLPTPTQSLQGFNVAGVDVAIANASQANLGYDPYSHLQWGRWSQGYTLSPTGTLTNPGDQHLHWIRNTLNETPTIPITGTANYRLIGNTDPTNQLGQVGVLGSATFNVNFSTGTIDSQLSLGVGGNNWQASGSTATIGGAGKPAHHFNGNYGTVSVNGTGGGNGNFTGFFTGDATAPTPTGAGMTYHLNHGSNQVNGSAAFSE